jgi:spermidine synthase
MGVIELRENNEDYQLVYPVEDVVYLNQSDHQKVEIIRHKKFGQMLFLDDVAQCSEHGYCEYHDTIAMNVEKAKNVLIIGGGDYFTARELLLNPEIESVDQVELDEMVAIVCSQYFSHAASVTQNEKFNLIIGDGIKYVNETDKKYDAVIVDVTDGFDGESCNFYENLKKICDKGSDLVLFAGSAFEDRHEKLVNHLLDLGYKDAYAVDFASEIYPGGLYKMIVAEL